MIENWQNKTLNYDLVKYPWHEWIRNTIRELYPEVDDLSKIHEVISPEQSVKICDHVQKSFLETHYQKNFEDFAKEYGEQLIGTNEYLIKRQPTLNLVMPDQAKKHRSRNENNMDAIDTSIWNKFYVRCRSRSQ